VQGSKAQLNNICCVLFHTLDKLFRPLEVTDSAQKLVLGWVLDTIRMSLELLGCHIDHLRELLDSIPPEQNRTTMKKGHKLLGGLHSMAVALPGAKGLFSLLQEALRHQADWQIWLNSGIHDCLKEFLMAVYRHSGLPYLPIQNCAAIPTGTPWCL
jgi:hypothetical protein